MLHFLIYANGGIGGTSAPVDADFANLVEPNGLARANLWKYGIPFEQGWLDKLYPGIGIWELNAAGEFLYMLSDYFMLYKLILVAKVRVCICCACELRCVNVWAFIRRA